MISDYGKVLRLDGQRDLFNNMPHYAEEKIDGSQISFGVFDGKLIIRSRNCQLDLNAPNGNFALAVQYIKKVRDQLRPGWTYRGECVTRLRHNVVTYQRLPKGFVAIWEIECFGMCFDYAFRSSEARRLGFEPVWQLPQHMPYDPSGESMLGGPREGIVIKALERQETLTGKLYHLRRKVISPEYSAKSGQRKHKIKDAGSFEINLKKTVNALVETDILEHSYQRAKEKLGHRPEMHEVGEMLKEVAADMGDEYRTLVAEELFKAAEKGVRKRLNRIAVEFLKERL